MRILAFMIVTGVALLLLSIAIAFGVSVGIVLGYETLKKKGGKNERNNGDDKKSY